MIYFLGDVHGNFGHVRRQALADRPAAVVFLGDIEAQRPFELEIEPLLQAGIEVRWIRGNHDTDRRENWDNLAATMPLNIDGRVVDIGGLRVAGLGGVFRGEIWYPDRTSMTGSAPHYTSHDAYCRTQRERRPARLRSRHDDEILFGRELKHLSSIFWETYETLWEQRADILVTHEAPSCHRHGFAAIDELAQAMGVRAVFHGHHHDCLDYREWDGRLGFRVHGVGFCGITDDSGRIVAAGDFDQARQYRSSHPAGER